MVSSRLFWASTGVLFIVFTCAFVAQLQADAADDPTQNEELVEAATAAYQCTQAEYNVNRATVEDVYQWSRRIMKAENSRDAAAAHVGRMRELHERVSALHQAGAAGGSAQDYESTRFYLLEARSHLTP
jgi:hypothetical protein